MQAGSNRWVRENRGKGRKEGRKEKRKNNRTEYALDHGHPAQHANKHPHPVEPGQIHRQVAREGHDACTREHGDVGDDLKDCGPRADILHGHWHGARAKLAEGPGVDPEAHVVVG
jgi:hypothetical protein